MDEPPAGGSWRERSTIARSDVVTAKWRFANRDQRSIFDGA